jgi:hypothetical protein
MNQNLASQLNNLTRKKERNLGRLNDPRPRVNRFTLQRINFVPSEKNASTAESPDGQEKPAIKYSFLYKLLSGIIQDTSLSHQCASKCFTIKIKKNLFTLF